MYLFLILLAPSGQDVSYSSVFEKLVVNETVIEGLKFLNIEEQGREANFRISKIPLPKTISLQGCDIGPSIEFNKKQWRAISKKSIANAQYVVYFSKIVNGNIYCKITKNTFKKDSVESLKANTWFGKVLNVFICINNSGEIISIKTDKVHSG